MATGTRRDPVAPSGATVHSEIDASDRRLRRELSFTQLLFISVGSIIGSGWLFATLAAGATAGPAVVLSWLIGAALILLVAINYAEIAGMLPRSGAVVRYPHLTHGGYLGFMLSWAFLISVVTTPAIEAEAVVTYASTYVGGLTRTATSHGQTVTLLTGPGIGFAVGLMAIFFVVNYVGVRFFGRWNQAFTWWKLVIPVVTFAFLFTIFRSSNYTSYGGFFSEGVPPIFLALSTSGIVFSYLGFRQALDYGGEARRPQRDIPLATILSIAICAAIYIGLQTAFTGAIDWHSLGVTPGHWTALEHSNWSDSPLYHALQAAGLGALTSFSYVLLADAFISPTGTGWLYMGAASRVAYGMGLHGDLPRPFAWLHERFRVPWLALAASAVVGCLFFLPLPSWYLFVGFVTSATVLTFIGGGVHLTVLRRTAPHLHRPFRLPWAWLLAPLGTLAGTMIFYWSGFQVLTYVVGVTFIGMPLYTLVHAPRHRWMSRRAGAVIGFTFLGAWICTFYWGKLTLDEIPTGWFYGALWGELAVLSAAVWLASNDAGRRMVRSGLWAIFLVLATYTLSYWGTYGPHHLVPDDNLVEIGIGLIGYYWGVWSGFETETMGEINASGSGTLAWDEDDASSEPLEREQAAAG